MKLFAVLLLSLLLSTPALAQTVGARVTFTTPDGKRHTGTIKEMKMVYKVEVDGGTKEQLLLKEQFTLVNTPPEATPNKPGEVTVDADNTLSADRPILSCPVPQKAVGKTAKPNAELFRKLIQCGFGEKPAQKGMDGAETVDIKSIQIGTPRKWDYTRDMGDGDAGTIVYPVKTVAVSKTFYRTRTVETEWIRVINIFVNSFGEWTVGSAQTVQMGAPKLIPR